MHKRILHKRAGVKQNENKFNFRDVFLDQSHLRQAGIKRMSDSNAWNKHAYYSDCFSNIIDVSGYAVYAWWNLTNAKFNVYNEVKSIGNH